MKQGISLIPIIGAALFYKARLKIISQLPLFEHILTDVNGMIISLGIFDSSIALQKSHI